jgi:DNA adenine methylase
MKTFVKSPLRYPGGKSRAIEQILQHIPSNIDDFREPFIGGGSVFLAMKSLFRKRIQHYWINDLNEDLIHFWQWVQKDTEQLINGVCALKVTYPQGQTLYQFLKDPANILTDFDRAVRFFIMNRVTFSGVMDAGGYSEQAFQKRFTDSSIERVATLGTWLNEVKITHGDYEALLSAPGENVFIFLDPPYLSATSSRLYGKRGELHTSFNHERFAEQMKKCTHRWLITYDDSPQIRELFSFANVVEWELQYGMNNYKQPSAAKGKELFLKNY